MYIFGLSLGLFALLLLLLYSFVRYIVALFKKSALLKIIKFNRPRYGQWDCYDLTSIADCLSGNCTDKIIIIGKTREAKWLFKQLLVHGCTAEKVSNVYGSVLFSDGKIIIVKKREPLDPYAKKAGYYLYHYAKRGMKLSFSERVGLPKIDYYQYAELTNEDGNKAIKFRIAK